MAPLGFPSFSLNTGLNHTGNLDLALGGALDMRTGIRNQVATRTWLVANTLGQNKGILSFKVGFRYWIVANRGTGRHYLR